MLQRLAKLGGSTFRIAALGALLSWAAFPPLDLWPLAWIGPAFWIWLMRRPEPLKEYGRRPYFTLWFVGFGYFLTTLAWLRLPHWTTACAWVALAFYLGFYLPVFVGLGRLAVHRLRVPVVLAAPIVWIGLELARAHLLSGFSMGELSHTQYRWIELIQVSDLGGAYAVDFVLFFVAASLARFVPCGDKRWSVWPLVPAALLLAMVLGYGHARLIHSPAKPELRVALIQGSVDIELKYDPDKQAFIHQQHVELSEEAVERFAPLDLIVWPETMFRYPLITCDDGATPPKGSGYTSQSAFERDIKGTARDVEAALAAMARRWNAALLLGVDAQHFGVDTVKQFNSAVFVDRQGEIEGRYDKMHRVPFGEYVPLVEHFPWLQHITPIPVSITAGDGPKAFDVKGLRLAPNICYESTLSHVIRGQVHVLEQAGRGPDVLVNLTNDGWFWGSSELDFHLVCAVFRAVECRKPFLIAANTGISAWIDADGRIVPPPRATPRDRRAACRSRPRRPP